VAEEFLHEQSSGHSELLGAQLGRASATLSSGASAGGANVYTRYRRGVPNEDDPIGAAWSAAIRAEEDKPEDQQQMCSMCYELLRLHDGLIRLSPGHTFHGVCMTKCFTVIIGPNPRTLQPSYVRSCALCRSPFIGTDAIQRRQILHSVGQRWDLTDADGRKRLAPRVIPPTIHNSSCAVQSVLENSRCSGGGPLATLGDLLSQVGKWCLAWAVYVFGMRDVAEGRKYVRMATVFYTLSFVEFGDSGVMGFRVVRETSTAVLLPTMHLMQDGDREINKHILRRIFIRLQTILRRAPETWNGQTVPHRVKRARDTLVAGLTSASATDFYGKAFVDDTVKALGATVGGFMFHLSKEVL